MRLQGTSAWDLALLQQKSKKSTFLFLKRMCSRIWEFLHQTLSAMLKCNFLPSKNLRDRRQRNIEFIRGRNFGELVWDNELQKYVSQWIYNRRRNIPPLTFNVISKLVRSLVGQFRGINTGNVVSCDSKDERGQVLANMLTKVLDNVKDDNDSKNKRCK